MLDIIYWIAGSFFLVLLSIIDFLTYDKFDGRIPSFLTTLFMIVSFLLNFPVSVSLGLLGLLLGLLLTDLEFWGGLADYKAFIGGSMLFHGLLEVLFFACFLTFFGLFYKWIVSRFTKKNDAKIPFIPTIFLSFFVSSLLFLILS